MDEYKRRRRRSRAVMSMFLDRAGVSIDNVDVATFDSDGSDLIALIVGIDPVQSGTGDPSPDNVRPITGHSSVNVIVSPTLNPMDGVITNIPLGTTVYGGTLDVLTGVLTVIHAVADTSQIGAAKSTATSSVGGSVFIASLQNVGNGMAGRDRYTPIDALSEVFAKCTENVWYVASMPDNSFFYNDSNLFIAASAYASISEFNAAMSGVKFLYPLATPVTIQLTGQQIATFLGTNNVWCSSGNIIHLEY